MKIKNKFLLTEDYDENFYRIYDSYETFNNDNNNFKKIEKWVFPNLSFKNTNILEAEVFTDIKLQDDKLYFVKSKWGGNASQPTVVRYYGSSDKFIVIGEDDYNDVDDYILLNSSPISLEEHNKINFETIINNQI